MLRKVRFPIRFKIMIALLFVITTVVSLITFTMANLFHADKTAYIHDLTSVIALHIAEEARSLLVGYQERLQVFARLVYEEDLPQEKKVELIKKLFEDFHEFVAVTLYEDGVEQATVYDARTLDTAGLAKDDLGRYRKERPLPLKQIGSDEVFVENSTVSDKLPTLTLAIAYETPGVDTQVVVAAVIRLDNLLRLAGRSKVFETFVVDAGGMLLAHTDPTRVVRRTVVDWIPRLKEIQNQRSLVTTEEYSQDGMEMVGGFAPVKFSRLLAGVQIPKTAAYLTARELLNNLMGISLVLLVGSGILGLFWSRRITRPIERLSEAAHVVGRGQFDVKIESSSRDEIGELAGSFNQMASELHTREEALEQAQAALVQSEKMAAFGQLGAGIAHEVKNPLAGILGYAQLALRKLENGNPLQKNLLIIEKETKRCKTIIDNLLKFARQEKTVHEPMEVNRIVQDSMVIMDHQLGINQVKLEKSLSEGLPSVLGNANQLQQVLMNLMINAQQAMEGKPGKVSISTQLSDSGPVEIRVADNGPGMTEEVRAKIFEPFFTTKPAGKGTGLGLSVTYGIIKDHRGEIRVESEPGKGATFIITLPSDKLGDETATKTLPFESRQGEGERG